MDTVGLLLKDPPFLAAALLFALSLSALLWSLAGLRTRLGSEGMGMSLSSPHFPPPQLPPSIPPEFEGTIKMPSLPPPPAQPSRVDTGVIAGMMDDKISALEKKLAAVESAARKEQTPAYLAPLLKRVLDAESELKGLKLAFTQLAAAQNALNAADISAKIHGMQKLLDNLTSGTDVSKPS